MSELNELFGPVASLPTSDPRHLSEVTDSIASRPEGERVPNMRVWCNPTMTYIYMDGLSANELHLENLIYLRGITLYGCPLERFPSVTHLTELATLEFSYGGKFHVIPDLSPLQKLTWLAFPEGQIEDASGIAHLPAVTYLDLGANRLTQLPPLDDLTELEILVVRGNQLTVLPELGAQSQLRQLNCEQNELTVLPPMNHIVGLDSLYCQENQLTELPELIGLVVLRHLYCNENLLTALPSLTGLGELYYFVCNDNQLTQLPDLTELTKVRYVKVHNNQLSAEAIDNALIQLAGVTTVTNGQFNYSGNPGSANNLRSTEATTAKTTLTGKGWTITV